MSTAALNNIWSQILALGMTDSNWDWLQDKISEQRQANKIMQSTPFPLNFTEEEWEKELELAMEEGEATEKETQQFYEKWGIAL